MKFFLVFFTFFLSCDLVGQYLGEVMYMYNSNLPLERGNCGETKLSFSKEQAYFQYFAHRKRTAPVVEGSKKIVSSYDKDGFPLIIDLKNRIYQQSLSVFMGQKAIIRSSLIPISWQELNEIKVDSMGMLLKKAIGEFGGRKYIVWYAPSLPYSFGPYKLHGLPGLIIEAYTVDGKASFKFISLKLYNKNQLQPYYTLERAKFNYTYEEYCTALDEFEQRLILNNSGPDGGVEVVRPKPDIQLEIGFRK